MHSAFALPSNGYPTFVNEQHSLFTDSSRRSAWVGDDGLLIALATITTFATFGKMIWSLQILRFIAAAVVVYIHLVFAAQYATGSPGFVPTHVALLGMVGVDIFFVLSGVVIAKTAPRLMPAQFAWRRVRRIFPIYLICSVPFVLIAGWWEFGWRDALATFLLWPATDKMTLPALHVGWTLSFELLFYLSAALVLVHRGWLYILLSLYAVAFMLRPFGPVFQFLGNPMIIEFLAGVLVAYTPLSRFGILAVPVGIAMLLVVGKLNVVPRGDMIDYLIGDISMHRVLVFGVPAVLIVYGTMHVRAKKSIWTYLGGASYALYLVHPTVIALLMSSWIMLPGNPDIMIAVGLIACILVAWRVHELAEKPLLRALPRELTSVPPIRTGVGPPTK